jgi:SAM-dependent methyltransferase
LALSKFITAKEVGVTPSALPDYPIRLGAAEQFALVRGHLGDLALDRASIYDTLPIKEDGTLDNVKWAETKAAVRPELALAIDVFVRGDTVSEADFRAAYGEDTYYALCSLGLLRGDNAVPGRLASPVWLYQVDGFLIASDRLEDAEGNAFAQPDDAVFPAFNHLTMRFLRILPDARGGDALDLCGGCGIGALHLARTARAAASADLTPRAAFFTQFNARLNGAAIESLCGDLYDPAGGRTYDLISAHPPFIAAVGAKRMIFRDADEFGESIARRIVEGLPTRLRTGGTAILVFAGWDAAEPLELRAQEWLGDSADHFDVVLAEYTRTPIEKVISDIRKVQKDVTEADVAAFEQNLRAWGAERRIYGALVFRRAERPAATAPLRLQLSDEAAGPVLQRAVDWRAARRRDDFSAQVAAAKPRPTPHVQMNARHVVRDGRLVLEDFLFEMAEGILGRLKPDPWVVPSLMQLDGTRSVGEVFVAAQAGKALPRDFGMTDFTHLVSVMLERGFLDADAPHAT